MQEAVGGRGARLACTALRRHEHHGWRPHISIIDTHLCATTWPPPRVLRASSRTSVALYSGGKGHPKPSSASHTTMGASA